MGGVWGVCVGEWGVFVGGVGVWGDGCVCGGVCFHSQLINYVLDP